MTSWTSFDDDERALTPLLEDYVQREDAATPLFDEDDSDENSIEVDADAEAEALRLVAAPAATRPAPTQKVGPACRGLPICEKAASCAHRAMVEFHREAHGRHALELVRELGRALPPTVPLVLVTLIADHVEPFNCEHYHETRYRHRVLLLVRMLRDLARPLLRDVAVLERELDRLPMRSRELEQKLADLAQLPRFVCEEGSEWRLALGSDQAPVAKSVREMVSDCSQPPGDPADCEQYAQAQTIFTATARAVRRIERAMGDLSLTILRSRDAATL